MRIVLETEDGGLRVHADDGAGYYWTPRPSEALAEIAARLERFVAADLALRRDGCALHVKVLAGICPTCGLPASDCVGVYV